MRIVRVLVYEGPEEWIKATWNGGHTPWLGGFSPGKGLTISSTVLTGRGIVEDWEGERAAKLTPEEIVGAVNVEEQGYVDEEDA